MKNSEYKIWLVGGTEQVNWVSFLLIHLNDPSKLILVDVLLELELAKQHSDYRPVWMPLNVDDLKSRWIGDREQVVISVGLSSRSHQDGHPLEAGVRGLMDACKCL